MARRRMQTEQDAQSREEIGAAFSRPTETWLENNAVFFEQFDEVARRWLDRRREALDATRQAIDEMRRTSDMGEMFRIQQEWVLGAMRRLAVDLGELGHAALGLTRTTASRWGRATEETAQDMAEAGRDLLNAAGAKPWSAPD